MKKILLLISFITFLWSDNPMLKKMFVVQNEASHEKIYAYLDKENKQYVSFFYRNKIEAVSICGFGIYDKVNQNTAFKLESHQKCEYDIEDGYAIKNGTFLIPFIKKYDEQIKNKYNRYDLLRSSYSGSGEERIKQFKNLLYQSLEKFIILEVINVPKGDSLNIREGSSSKSKIIHNLPQGSKRLFTKKINIMNLKDNLWLKVEYFDEDSYKYKKGWIYKKYIQISPTYDNIKLANFNFYKELGDIYWVLKEKSKAIKAYTAYIKQMHEKGKQNKIPKQVIKRAESEI